MTLYAASGRLIPFNSNSPTGLTFTALSTFVSTRGTTQDLPRLCFIAKARGHVRYRPDGGIVEASLITNRAESSEAVRNPDAEANLVPEAAPGCRQSSEGVAQFKGHEDSLERGVL